MEALFAYLIIGLGGFVFFIEFVEFLLVCMGLAQPKPLPSEPEKPMTDEEINDMLRMMR